MSKETPSGNGLNPCITLWLVVVILLWTQTWGLVKGSMRRDVKEEELERLRLDLEIERRVNKKLVKTRDHQATHTHGEAHHPRVVQKLPSDTERFTVVLMSYPKSERFHRLAGIIEEVQGWGDIAAEILLVWNGNASQVPASIEALTHTTSVPLRILPQAANKLDNRWRVWRSVKTDAVLNMDDDVNVKARGARCLFDIWRSAPDRLIGVDVRAHSDQQAAIDKAERRTGMKLTGTFAYSPRHTDDSGRKVYSIALPRALMGHRRYWQAYDAAAPQLRETIDSLLCDDIAFNFLVANMSRMGPIYARAPFAPFPESQSSNSLQKLKNMKARRQSCLPALSKVFNNMPLQHTPWYASCAWDGESGNHGKA